MEDDEDEESRLHHRSRLGDDVENDQERSDDEMDGESYHNQSADQQLAKKLVRYAISCEFSRTPIKRDGIKERGRSSRQPHPDQLEQQLTWVKYWAKTGEPLSAYSSWRKNS